MIIRCLDVETAGLAPPAGVVELAHCDLRDAPNGNGWEVVGGAGRFCNPGQPIPPEASAVHHITDEDVAGHGSLEAVSAELYFAADQVVAFAAYNNRFDCQWLTPELIGSKPWIDTYRCALWLWPEAPSHSLHALRYWRKPAGLDRAIATSHRAYGDAYVAAHLLRDMLTLTTGKQLVAWSRGPALLPRFTFGKHAMKPLAEVDPSYLEWVLGQDFDEDVKFSARHWLDRHQASQHEAA